MLDTLAHLSTDDIGFMEIAPENWIGVGGAWKKKLRSYTEKFPFICHGLSLSLGGPAPLDLALLESLKGFLRDHQVSRYSEHLSYSGDDGHLYELLPMPFTRQAADHVVARIRQTQDILGQRIAIENSTYYFSLAQEMTEVEFVNYILEQADCDLLLDVNNLFINSVNHQYDPLAYLDQLQGTRTAYIHIAGHDSASEHFYVDTHGSPVADGVWDLLGLAYARIGARPTLLERDTNIPPVGALLAELAQIRLLQSAGRR